jgi:hypothetical protein
MKNLIFLLNFNKINKFYNLILKFQLKYPLLDNKIYLYLIELTTIKLLFKQKLVNKLTLI